MNIQLNPSKTCLMIHKDTPINQMRQGLNNCCYRICDEFDNPYGNNTLFHQCVKNCKTFSDDMIFNMGKCPVDYKTKFVEPPKHLRVTNALNYIESEDFLNNCLKDCRTNECVKMCHKINDSIEKYSKNIEKSKMNDDNKNKDNGYFNGTNVIYYVLSFIILLFFIEKIM